MTHSIHTNLTSTSLIEAKNISLTIGERHILKNVSIRVNAGDLKVLIGPSGGGKSTFLQCINQLIQPDTGEIWLEGKQVDLKDKTSLCQLRQNVGMIFQDFNLFDHLNALDNITLALCKVRHFSKMDAQKRAKKELVRVGLGSRADLYPAQLSGGQKQRVAIARALAMDPKVLLLDEPTSALDPELVGEVLAVIRDLAANGMPMIMATHQMDFVQSLATEVLFMQAGAIIEQDTPRVLLAPESKTRTLDFCSKIHSLRDCAPCTYVEKNAIQVSVDTHFAEKDKV